MDTLAARFVIVGSGGSSSLPNLRHVLQKDAECKVCQEAWSNPASKNRRGNPSLLVTLKSAAGEHHLLVDCGKTFEEAVRRHFPSLGVQGVNAVLLTHGHADAILGLDSLREVQLAREPPECWTLQAKTPIFATADTVKELWHHFHYMLPADCGEPAGCTLRRRSSTARIVGGMVPHCVEEFEPFQPLPGLQVEPLPVLHGGTYVCMAFRFGVHGEVLYLSDVSKVPDNTMAVLKASRAEILVLDTLLKSGPSYSHFGLEQALNLVRELRPKRTLLVGMSCQFDHERDNAELQKLKEEGLEVELAFDGLQFELLMEAAPPMPDAEDFLEDEAYELQLPAPLTWTAWLRDLATRVCFKS